MFVFITKDDDDQDGNEVRVVARAETLQALLAIRSYNLTNTWSYPRNKLKATKSGITTDTMVYAPSGKSVPGTVYEVLP